MSSTEAHRPWDFDYIPRPSDNPLGPPRREDPLERERCLLKVMMGHDGFDFNIGFFRYIISLNVGVILGPKGPTVT